MSSDLEQRVRALEQQLGKVMEWLRRLDEQTRRSLSLEELLYGEGED